MTMPLTNRRAAPIDAVAAQIEAARQASGAADRRSADTRRETREQKPSTRS